jgi:hypothetical protein
MSKKERKSGEGLSGPITDEGGRQRVQVVVRCRPLNKREKEAGVKSILNCNAEDKEVKVGMKNRPKTYTFDKVYGQYSKQAEVYDQTVSPIIDEVLQGFNCTVFAYGQTGTGKTHTMEGDLKDSDKAGIIPRSVRGIFQHLEKMDNAEYSVRALLKMCSTLSSNFALARYVCLTWRYTMRNSRIFYALKRTKRSVSATTLATGSRARIWKR